MENCENWEDGFPDKPSPEDCCNSGCNPCIFDVYEEQIRKFKNRKVESKKGLNCMSPLKYNVFKLIDKIQHTLDTYLCTFRYEGLDREKLSLHFKPGQHFLLKGESIDDRACKFTRAYTPISLNDQLLSFTILIKFYDGGKMSEYLKTVQVNDDTLWRGPYGDYQFSFDTRYLLCIAQGTGIAPIYSVIQEILNNETCETFIKLFFCCRNEILLRNQLYDLSSYWNFKCEIFLKGANLTPKYNEIVKLKRFEKDDLKNYLGQINKDQLVILICGSDEFSQSIIGECNTACNKIHIF